MIRQDGRIVAEHSCSFGRASPQAWRACAMAHPIRPWGCSRPRWGACGASSPAPATAIGRSSISSPPFSPTAAGGCGCRRPSDCAGRHSADVVLNMLARQRDLSPATDNPCSGRLRNPDQLRRRALPPKLSPEGVKLDADRGWNLEARLAAQKSHLMLKSRPAQAWSSALRSFLFHGTESRLKNHGIAQGNRFFQLPMCQMDSHCRAFRASILVVRHGSTRR
jgi:hypothetical protein